MMIVVKRMKLKVIFQKSFLGSEVMNYFLTKADFFSLSTRYSCIHSAIYAVADFPNEIRTNIHLELEKKLGLVWPPVGRPA